MDGLSKSELVWTWRERVIGEARKAGLQEGRREMLANMLRGKFGNLPPRVVSYLQGVNDPAVLDEMGMRLLTAVSLEDIMILEG